MYFFILFAAAISVVSVVEAKAVFAHYMVCVTLEDERIGIWELGGRKQAD